MEIRNASLFKASNAEVAQLVEHNLAKVGVARSNRVFCSDEKVALILSATFFIGHDDHTKDFFSTMDAMYPQYSRLDYGLMIGTGLSFRIKQGPVINAELYYYQGLKDQSNIISFEMANRANPSKQLQQQLRFQISIIDLL